MTKDKELKKLTRYQLLELLLIQTERADELQKKTEELEKKLIQRDLSFLELGSVANVAVQISGVFEASQQAADLYLEEAKKQADNIVKEAYKKAEEIVSEAKKSAGISDKECNTLLETTIK